MIAKRYRLREREIKKVLRSGKPFFSSVLRADVRPNRLHHARFALILSAKHVAWSVQRNFFRRRFYAAMASVRDARWLDIVVRAKKWVKLDRRSAVSREQFDASIATLLSAIFSAF